MPSDAKLRYVILYTVGVALLVFIINRVVLNAPWQSSLMWTAMFAAIAFASASLYRLPIYLSAAPTAYQLLKQADTQLYIRGRTISCSVTFLLGW